jgi:hypothetical protein
MINATAHQRHHFSLLILIGISIILGACSKQAWYEGARSSQTAHCMEEPLSEYEDCKRQPNENYDDYRKTREDLIQENSGN